LREYAGAKDLTPFGTPPAADCAESRCSLCGLPLGHSRLRKAIGGEVLRFCCPGCEQVFSLLSVSPGGIPRNFRSTELYRACVQSGIILAGVPFSLPSPSSVEAIAESDIPPLPLTLRVGGMWCPACSWLIEEVLRRTRGVLEPRVSFFSDRVELKYLPHLLSPAEIMERIARLGYHPSPEREGESLSREKKDLLVRLGVSAILAGNIMMISFALYFGFFRGLSPRVIEYFSYPLWLMATPALFYGGLPILRKGIAGLLYRRPTMESLIAIASLSAYFYSVYQMGRGSLHLYFDTASMLITLVLLGRYVELYAREKAAGGIIGLYRLSGQKVRLPGQGRENWVSSEAVQPGDLFLVLNGERVPLDGIILEGQGEMDESILTGEPRLVGKGPGDAVKAGALLLGGELKIRTTRVGRESSLGQMITLMQEALDKKNPAERVADRIIRWFVPVILAIAGAAGLSLWFFHAPGDEVLLRSLTVLVIACPCALGIATPIVKLASVGLAKSKGILVRDPAALEAVKDLDVWVFDKTGTLTEGAFSLLEVVPREGMEADRVLSLVASVEAHSQHFLAWEMGRKAREKSLNLGEVEEFETLEGMGVRGRVGGQKIFVGNRKLMALETLRIDHAQEEKAREAEARGMTVVFAGWAGKTQALFFFGDSLRKGVPEMLRDLHARGISTWLVSGDSRETTQVMAGQSGITQFRGGALPHEKVGLIKSLQQNGRRVGMVGDGINDAPALAQADVGIALGTGTNILQEASDLTFLASDPTRVGDAIELSALTVRTIRQNLFFAFLYNSIGIPLALFGWLNPLIAVLAMIASSLTVIGNALRISKVKEFQAGSAFLHGTGGMIKALAPGPPGKVP
jgi:heavy metal translocating P-type ATPase